MFLREEWGWLRAAAVRPDTGGCSGRGPRGCSGDRRWTAGTATGLRWPLCLGLTRRHQGAWTAALPPGPVGRDNTYNNSNRCGRNFPATSWTCRVSSAPGCTPSAQLTAPPWGCEASSVVTLRPLVWQDDLWFLCGKYDFSTEGGVAPKRHVRILTRVPGNGRY